MCTIIIHHMHRPYHLGRSSRDSVDTLKYVLAISLTHDPTRDSLSSDLTCFYTDLSHAERVSKGAEEWYNNDPTIRNSLIYRVASKG